MGRSPLREQRPWTDGLRLRGRTRRTHRAGRTRLAYLAVMVVALAGALQIAPSAATFTSAGTNTSNSFNADTVTPPSGLSASTTCVPALTPTYRASSTNNPASSGTSITLTTPTTSIGDYLIAVVMLETSGHTMTTPSGWTLLQTQSNSDMVVAAYAMATPASPAASYTFTWTGSVYSTGILAAYSGTSAVQTSGSQSNGNSIIATAPSVTATSTPATLLTLLNHDVDDTPDSTPAGMTNRDGVDDVSGYNYDYMTLSDQTLAATGATGTRSGNNTNGYSGISVGISIVLSGTTGNGPSLTPTYRASRTNAPSTSSSSIALNTPLTSVGDYLVALVVVLDPSAGRTLSTPSGWTFVQSNTTGSMLVGTYVMATPASPAASYTFSWTGGSSYRMGILASYSGVSGVQTSASQSNGNSVTVTAPSVTASSVPATLLTVFNHDVFGYWDNTPAGMTSRKNLEDMDGGYQVLGLFDQTISATGATGTRSAANSDSDSGTSVGISILLTGNSNTTDSAALTWTATPYTSATGYEVIRDGSTTTSVSGRTTTTWTDTTTSGGAHSYTLSAVLATWRSVTISTSISACP